LPLLRETPWRLLGDEQCLHNVQNTLRGCDAQDLGVSLTLARQKAGASLKHQMLYRNGDVQLQVRLSVALYTIPSGTANLADGRRRRCCSVVRETIWNETGCYKDTTNPPDEINLL
jgi:hypothetical protein